ncbi:MAG: PorP/SprF family type IX secretion system membrane protein [Bacteroidales bacterium]|nr:PorP/SprF family type IX secretion system membrane protein [Bacteroidales bacterium]
MKKIYFFVIILLVSGTIYSQDNHYTMFYKSPAMLNPANTGNFEGKWRLNSTFRQQGDLNLNPYSSLFFSFDMPVFYFNRLGSFGITALNNCTAGNTLNDKSIQFSTAHFVKISKASYLHMGFGFSLVNKSLASEGLTFPNQFDNSIGLFNPVFENNENFNSYNIWYFDMCLGAMWSRITEKISTQLGFALFHYNQPNIYFFDEDSKLKPRYQFHFYALYNVSSTIFVKPKFLYANQSAASELIIGSDIGLNILDKKLKKIYAGCFVRAGFNRNTDAVLFSLGFNFSKCSFNFSYDYSFVFNNTYSNDPTFEIAVFYTLPRLTVDKRAIQCEIF